MKVSVIIPVYNTEKYLKKCLDSVVNQTYKNIEIIIINDGTLDNSEKIILDYQKKHSNIIYLKQKNKGQASARNLGIKKASGDYITFIDSDDYVDLNMIGSMVSLINSKTDIVICDIKKEYEDKTVLFKNYWNIKKESNKNYMTSHMGPVARLYKTSLFKDNKIYFKEGVIYEDLATVPIIGMYVNEIKYLDKAYYHYVIRSNSSMNKIVYDKKLENIFDVMKHLYSNIKDGFSDEIEYLFIEHLLYSASLRFLKFNRTDMVNKIVEIMKDKFPKYNKNVYYKKKSIKFKMVCFLVYHKLYGLLKLLVRSK